MGGFDAYAFGIRVDLGRAPLDRSTLDRVQAALAEAAPGWSERTELAMAGRWSIGDAFDIGLPGSLDAVIQAHRFGGSRAKPTVGAKAWTVLDLRYVLAGADRGASVDLFYAGSPNAGEPAWLTHLAVETTHREVDGEPAGAWVERVFRALCGHLAPPRATAASMGEAVGADRRRLSDSIEWLTYLGPEAASTVPRAAVAAIPKVAVDGVAGGLLVRLDPAPGPRRGSTYWERRRAVADTIDPPPSPSRLRLPFGRRRRRSWWPPAGSLTPPAATPVQPAIPMPALTILHGGIPQYRGARYEGARVAQMFFDTPGAVIEGFEAVRCEFDNVSIGSRNDGELPVYVRSCTLTRCRASLAHFGLVVVEDSVIEGYSGGFTPTASVLLRHVTLRGSIDAFDLRAPGELVGAGHRSLPSFHDGFYRSVDWALDIRDARFRRCDISGVPGHLVRRDPATQVLVTRGRAMAGPWREVAGQHPWVFALEQLVESKDESRVLVACRRGKDFAGELEVIRRLREAGIAEPD